MRYLFAGTLLLLALEHSPASTTSEAKTGATAMRSPAKSASNREANRGGTVPFLLRHALVQCSPFNAQSCIPNGGSRGFPLASPSTFSGTAPNAASMDLHLRQTLTLPAVMESRSFSPQPSPWMQEAAAIWPVSPSPWNTAGSIPWGITGGPVSLHHPAVQTWSAYYPARGPWELGIPRQDFLPSYPTSPIGQPPTTPAVAVYFLTISPQARAHRLHLLPARDRPHSWGFSAGASR